MGQSCVEFVTEEDLDNMLHHQYEDKMLEALDAYFREEDIKAAKLEIEAARPKYDYREQGEIGEEIAAYMIAKERGYELCPFDRNPSGHGIDIFAEKTANGQTRYLIVEAKHRAESLPRSVAKGKTKDNAHQMSLEWVNVRLDAMQNPKTPYYSPRNSELAADIAKVLASNSTAVERLGFHIHPDTGFLSVYKAEAIKEDPKKDNWYPVDLHTGEPLY